MVQYRLINILSAFVIKTLAVFKIKVLANFTDKEIVKDVIGENVHILPIGKVKVIVNVKNVIFLVVKSVIKSREGRRNINDG